MAKISIDTNDYPIIILQNESGAPKLYENGEVKELTQLDAQYEPTGEKKHYYTFGYNPSKSKLGNEFLSIDYGKLVRDCLNKC
ncbi:hypothetical protein [Oceanobacillus oncorhynchi]|uniref:hypothetical protein n=1 Tax=Oceanobacillus oncorhynchi TaxID=545501 RepID=UPI0034D664BD